MKKFGESKKFIIFSLLIACAGSLFAQTYKVEDIVSPAYVNQLKKDGMVRIIHSEGDQELKLIPNVEYKKNCLNNKIAKKAGNYPFIAESLFYIPKSEILKESKSNKKTFDVDDISVVFRSISKMEGMLFNPSGKAKSEILYKECYEVDGPSTKIRIPDQTAGSADGKVLYAIQHDTTFGKGVYELKYYQNQNSLYAVFNNLDPMGIGPIQAVSPKDMKINIIAIDCGDYLCLYLVADTDCKKFPGIASTLEKSFIPRIDAIKDWFMKQF